MYNTWLLHLNSVTVFLYFCTLRLTFIAPFYNIDIIEKAIEEWKSSTFGMSFRWSRWNLPGLRPSILLWNKKKFQMFLLLVFQIDVNGEQEHKKAVSSPFMVVVYSLRKLNSSLCDFSTEVRVKQHFRNPKVRLCIKLQNLLILSFCRTSSLYSIFFCYTTRWRQFCWGNFLALPSCPWCTPVWINPAGYCYRVHKSIWIRHLPSFLKSTQKLDSLWLRTLSFWRIDQLLSTSVVLRFTNA